MANRRLRTLHAQIEERVRIFCAIIYECKTITIIQVLTLFNTDLHRHQEKWKSLLTEIRQVFKDAEALGFHEKNMKAWKAHWDRQLYKALECQYLIGLESLDQQIPDIKVELIFR